MDYQENFLATQADSEKQMTRKPNQQQLQQTLQQHFAFEHLVQVLPCQCLSGLYLCLWPFLCLWDSCLFVLWLSFLCLWLDSVYPYLLSHKALELRCCDKSDSLCSEHCQELLVLVSVQLDGLMAGSLPSPTAIWIDSRREQSPKLLLLTRQLSKFSLTWQ